VTVASAEPAVSVRRLTHRYGERLALSDVSLTVERGEMVGLLGPNGGGKTTLFRILATLLRPSQGDALVLGRSVVGDPGGVRRALGVVFQRPSLDVKLTVRENLIHHGHLYGLRGADLRARCEAALSAVALADRAHDRVEALSGGLQRRAELAKGILHRPSVLLLDEPNTGLDPNARRDFLNHLEGLRRAEGVTVLLTTHFLEEADRCDRVGILHEGILAACDAPGRLKSSLGGEVLVLTGPNPETLRAKIRERCGIEAAAVGGTLRIERPEALRLASELVDAFPAEISSASWGQPTLDDVFVHLTGRRLEEAAA
jgi:ABC-2 type transport system ATP-binding protein